MLLVSQRRRSTDIWPGFVDALAALLMVVVFVLLLFSLGQYFLTDALTGRDKALDTLRGRAAELANVLAMERKEKAALDQKLRETTGKLQASVRLREELTTNLNAMTAQAQAAADETRRISTELAGVTSRLTTSEQTVASQQASLDQLNQEKARLEQSLAASQQATRDQEQLSAEAQAKVNDLDSRIASLNEQLARISKALEASEAKVASQGVQIEDLGNRLNVALANKVEELARYRSEFFGKLREALKDNKDVRVEGDRFVLPSGVLFGSASAELDASGKHQIAAVTDTLQEIAKTIPPDIDWVLRVDGHTDRRPIRVVFPSNWELSSARAISIVKYMIELGVPADRLVAAGFGEFHPIDPADTEEAYARNRRIELKLSSR
jgi:chemotaxis protein MotB